MEPTVRPAKGTRTSLDSEGCVIPGWNNWNFKPIQGNGSKPDVKDIVSWAYAHNIGRSHISSIVASDSDLLRGQL